MLPRSVVVVLWGEMEWGAREDWKKGSGGWLRPEGFGCRKIFGWSPGGAAPPRGGGAGSEAQGGTPRARPSRPRTGAADGRHGAPGRLDRRRHRRPSRVAARPSRGIVRAPSDRAAHRSSDPIRAGAVGRKSLAQSRHAKTSRPPCWFCIGPPVRRAIIMGASRSGPDLFIVNHATCPTAPCPAQGVHHDATAHVFSVP